MDENIIVCVPGNVIFSVNGIVLLKNKQYIFFIGQRLHQSGKLCIGGPGTYEYQGSIYSKLAGLVDIVQEERVRNWRVLLQKFLIDAIIVNC